MHPIHHLHSRFGFGLTPAEWQKQQSQSVDRAVTQLLKDARRQKPIAPPDESIPDNIRTMSDEERAEIIKDRLLSVATINADWLSRMADPEASPLLERVCLFWHGHFACDIKSGGLAASYLNTIRQHALGHFGDLAKGIAREPAMIRYLNNQQNRKQSPNENFARELLELFTIGRGNYTEQDIKEAARAFTGWSSNFDGTFRFRRFAHDYGTKTFMGRTGKWDGDDIIDIILEQRATAAFLAGKMYRYFVNPTDDQQRISEIADKLYDSGYHIGETLEYMMRSDWFYAPQHWRAQIKSPVELIAGLMRSLGIQTEEPLSLIYLQRVLGQVLFKPPNVAGWPGGRHWIDNATLMARLNLPSVMILGSGMVGRAKDNPKSAMREDGPRKLKVSVDLRPLLAVGQAKNPGTALAQLSAYLLPGMDLPTDLIERYARASSPQESVAFAAIRLMSMPEYQLS